MQIESEFKPYSLEAEQGVIGAMMIRPSLITELAAELQPGDFYWPEHGELFGSIVALHAERQPVDPVTVGESIGVLSNGDQAIFYAGTIAKNVPSAANAMAYANIVKQRALERRFVAAADTVAERAREAKPLPERIAEAQTLILGLDAMDDGAEVEQVGDLLFGHVDELERRLARGGAMDGLSTGIASLDTVMRGMKPGNMIVVAGRPGSGKTTLALNMAVNTSIKENTPTLFFSLEMSKSELLDRVLASVAEIELSALQDGSATEGLGGQKLLAAAARLKQAPLHICDRPGMTMGRIRAISRRYKARHNLGLIVLDYLGLVDPERSTGNRVQDVSEMSRQCKLMAKEIGCPVIVLAQLSRKCEERNDKRPMASDLRDSGAIEQDADVILMAYRDEMYNPESPSKGFAEAIIVKHRHSQPGTAYLEYQGRFSRFLHTEWRPAMNDNPAPQRQGRGLTSMYARG